MPLNAEQQEAVNAREGVYAVIAGPGSGKTKVIIERYKALVGEGVSTDDILVLTFTSKAAEELRRRATGSNKQPPSSRPSGFRTFHSLALEFAKAERQHFPFQLAPFPLTAEVHEGGYDKHIAASTLARRAIRNYPGVKYNEFAGYVSGQKRHLIWPPKSLANAILPRHRLLAQSYGDYVKLCRTYGLLDYDDLLIYMHGILRDQSEVLDRWNFKYAMCDESQDCDELQWSIIRLISTRSGNLFCVGDANQCVYGWRSAQPELFVEFHKMFPSTRYIFLGTNYRSTPEIVEVVRNSAPVKNDLVNRFRAVNPSGWEPEVVAYGNQLEEADGVIETARTLPGETAILARTNQYLALFEEKCAAEEIKFYTLGDSGFWKQPEVRNTIAYYKKKWAPDRDINDVITDLRRRELQYREEESASDNDPAMSMVILSRVAARFETLGDFLGYANRASHASRKSKSAIAIGTVHGSKGLEFDSVFLVGCQDGIMPHKKSEDLEEEARIFFVAVSRPKTRLHISHVGAPSRFISSVLATQTQ